MNRTALARRHHLSAGATLATIATLGCNGSTISAPTPGDGSSDVTIAGDGGVVDGTFAHDSVVSDQTVEAVGGDMSVEASVDGGEDDARGDAGLSEAGIDAAGISEAGLGAGDASPACGPSLAFCNGVCVDAGVASAACAVPWSYVANVNALAIAVDNDNLYWTESAYAGGSVMKLPKSGDAAGTPVTLASTTTAIPDGLAVDATKVYWGEYGNAPDGGAMNSLPISAAGGTPNMLAAGGATVLAISGSTLCFGATQAVGCLPVTGGPVTILNPVQGGQVLSMAVDATNAYWTVFSTNGAVFSAPIAGGPVNLLVAHTDRPMGIAVDANHVYWVGDGNGTVNAMPIGGGPVTTLATGPGYAEFLTLDSGYLFWSAGLDTNSGAILKMPVTGGTPTVLAWDIYGGGPLVVDAQFVYFIVQNGSIGKAPR